MTSQSLVILTVDRLALAVCAYVHTDLATWDTAYTLQIEGWIIR